MKKNNYNRDILNIEDRFEEEYQNMRRNLKSFKGENTRLKYDFNQ